MNSSDSAERAAQGTAALVPEGPVTTGDDLEVLCVICHATTSFPHDHQPDNSGLDDGPLIRAPRKKPAPKSAEEMRLIRAKAWQTRRALTSGGSNG